MSKRILFKSLLVIVAVFSFLIFTNGVFAQGLSADAFERVKEVQQRHTEKLMAKRGVVGTAVGMGQGAQPVMLILLEYGGIPGIPEGLDGIPVRPLVTGKFYALPKPDSPPGQDNKPPKERTPSIPLLDSTGRFLLVCRQVILISPPGPSAVESLMVRSMPSVTTMSMLM